MTRLCDLLATFNDEKFVPHINCFIDDNVGLLTIICGIILDDFDNILTCQLSLQVVSRVGTDDYEEKDHNLIRPASYAIEDSNQRQLVED